MGSLRDLKVGLVVGGVMLLWWGRGWVRAIPGLLFRLLCGLCRDQVLGREARSVPPRGAAGAPGDSR